MMLSNSIETMAQNTPLKDVELKTLKLGILKLEYLKLNIYLKTMFWMWSFLPNRAESLFCQIQRDTFIIAMTSNPHQRTVIIPSSQFGVVVVPHCAKYDFYICVKDLDPLMIYFNYKDIRIFWWSNGFYLKQMQFILNHNVLWI